MNEWAKIYSEYGLKSMIDETKKKIKESEKEYQEVCEGKRYNPLCADGWKKQIKSDIEDYEKHIAELEEALKIKQEMINS